MSPPLQPNQPNYADFIISNCQRLIVMAQVAATNPTPVNVDAFIQAHINGNVSGLPLPVLKPTSTVDGETYNWAEYITALTDVITKWVELRQVLGGAFSVNTTASVW
jgi:hypothetical protein